MSESFETILKHAGLNLPIDEINRLSPYFELYRETLKQLYEADLKAHEPANQFIADIIFKKINYSNFPSFFNKKRFGCINRRFIGRTSKFF